MAEPFLKRVIILLVISFILVAIVGAGCTSRTTTTKKTLDDEQTGSSTTVTTTEKIAAKSTTTRPTTKSTTIPTTLATTMPTPKITPRYVKGDIVADDQKEEVYGSIILDYSSSSNEYKTETIFTNLYSGWGHYSTYSPNWWPIQLIESRYPYKVAHVNPDSVPVGDPDSASLRSTSYSSYQTTSSDKSSTSGGTWDCSYNRYNCADFATQAEAQACYDYCMSCGVGDIHDLDRDNDGIACESNK
jgi:hypothetical protein